MPDDMKRTIQRGMIAVALLLAVAAPASAQRVSRVARPAPGVEELSRLDALPLFKESVSVSSVSSYDRAGGNDDGFSGKYSYLRREPGGLVIADLKGPGVIYRIWTPTPSDDLIEFYFDGELSPRLSLPFRDLFSGERAPFLRPVVGSGGGGFYSYLPLAYRESCKVVVKADNFQFYQINYATYPAGSALQSFDARPSGDFTARLERARRLFAAAGADVSAYAAPAGARVETRTFNGTLAAGRPVTVFETRQPGRIVGLKLGPAQAFAGKARDIVLRVYWDGESRPAIECPVGDFFGYSYGQPAIKSLVLGTSDGVNYAYLPMPFDRAARVELISERAGGAPVEVQAEIKLANVGRAPDEGRLYARWARENPTVEGRPFTFVEAGGRGHVVGFILQAQGLEPGAIPEFFEGDDETVIDGATAIRGTGSEDFFNGGWYDVPGRWEDRVSLPLSGCLDFKRFLGRTGGYRFLLTDAYAYRQRVRSTIEHGPAGNKFPSDYTGVTFLYSDANPSAPRLPAVASRRVRDPDHVVFTPGWTTPIHAFSWANATLSKHDDRVGNENLRYLSMKAEGGEVFGPHYISFICEMPAAGRYRVSVEALEGPTQGIVRLFRDEVGVGPAADLYARERRHGAARPLGELELREGDNRIMFKLVGRNPESAGTGFDVYRIIFRKIG